MFLFDANFLIALGDADHVHHEKAQAFFATKKQDGWATCPLTENAFLRILGHPNYPKGPGSPSAARTLLQEFICQPGHQFWDDTISLVDSRKFPTLPGSKKPHRLLPPRPRNQKWWKTRHFRPKNRPQFIARRNFLLSSYSR